MQSQTIASGPDLVPARMVNEFVYCPRLAYLEWAQGEWDDNLDTLEGRWVHRRVDDEPATPVEGPIDDDSVRVARSVMLSSDRLGAIARIDLLEAVGQVATPVEYKRGNKPDLEEGAWEPERVQVCLQGLILRDNGYRCDSGVIYFAGSRARVDIPIDDELIAVTERAVTDLRALAASSQLPPPLVDSPKCPRCSLNAICLPDETNLWRGTSPAGEVRRLVPGRPEGLPLHVQAQGASISKVGEAFRISAPGEEAVQVRAFDISSVACFGNVQVTTQALRAFCDNDVPVTLHSQSGWLVGVLGGGIGHKNVELRQRQHAVAADPAASLAIAHRFVTGKILNQRTLLRRNAEGLAPRVLGSMAWQARQARGARNVTQLMGMEGSAAREYFAVLPLMLRGDGEWAARRFAANGRNRRPPRDEVNAALSFLYALLVRDCTLASLAVGFDPYVGFLHAPRYGRPSLALDIAEEFRPLIADSVAIRAFNQGEVRGDSFLRRARGVGLTPAGRRAVIRAYERRLQESVTHPVFGYSVSYRRVLELQARLLRAVLLGEAELYRAFTTR
jgi:CRISP-associated protein Cas1